MRQPFLSVLTITVFLYCPFATSIKQLDRLQAILSTLLDNLTEDSGFQVQVFTDSVVDVRSVTKHRALFSINRLADIQSLLSRGDRSVPAPYVVINSGSTNVIRSQLLQIANFYKHQSDLVSAFYFILMWPSPWNETGAHDILKRHFSFVTLKSLLYLAVDSGEEQELWEFYSVVNVTVLRRVMPKVYSFTSPVSRRSDFQSGVLRAIFKGRERMPAMTKEVQVGQDFEATDGLVIDLLNILSWRLNFQVQWIHGSAWIHTDASGVPGGMAEQLRTHQGDLIVAMSEFLPARRKHLGMSQPVIALPLYAFYRKPHPSSYQNTLVEAFGLTLWLTIGGNIMVIYFSLIFIEWMQSRLHLRNIVENAEIFSYRTAFFWIIAAYCQQGMHLTTSAVSLRVMTVVTLTSSLLLFTAYSASIVSIFSVEKNYFQTIDHLMNHGFTLYGNNYSITGRGLVRGQATRDGVAESSRKMEFPEVITHIEQTQSALVTTRSVFRGIGSSFNFTNHELCPWLSETRLQHNWHLEGMLYRKNDPIIKYIDVQLAQLRTAGLLQRLRLSFENALAHNCDPPKKTPRKVLFADVRGAYQVLSIGFLISLVAVAFEGILARFRRYN